MTCPDVDNRLRHLMNHLVDELSDEMDVALDGETGTLTLICNVDFASWTLRMVDE